MPEIRTQHLMTLAIGVEKPLVVGPTPLGTKINVNITGGTFEGARLKGEILAGGSDWIILRGDGAVQLDVRLTLRTHDASLINMIYRGIRHGPPAVIERLNRGEEVDPSQYYFRTAPFFDTAAEKYAWLNKIVAIATGQRKASGPIYDVFEVL